MPIENSPSVKKKNRRKPRSKNKSKNVNLVDNTEKLKTNDITCTIKAVSDQTNGKVIRIRNELCQHVNESLYVNSCKSATYTTIYNEKLGCKKVQLDSTTINTDVTNRCTNKILHQNGIDEMSQVRPKNRGFTVSHLQSSSVQTAKKMHKREKKVSDKRNKAFCNFWQKESVLEGLKKGELIKGVLRINQKNSHEAYVKNDDSTKPDYWIPTEVKRNRALEGDVVVLAINEGENDQKTGSVVYIAEEIHPRTAIGELKLMPDKNKKFAAFYPRDLRMPLMRIPANCCPDSFHLKSDEYADSLFMVKITEWNDTRFAIGTIISNVGTRGNLESETKALLLENQLDVTPFPDSVKQFIPTANSINENDLINRQDLRRECIFTIDPVQARDLDDAVSCKELSNGNLQVGVHVADVSYFLKEATPLDKLVSEKATTIYLVNSVYHMLPQEMCLDYSLLPGKDKLAFSVLWEMEPDGTIINHQFSRTVINSCVQLSYEHAQRMIDDPSCVDINLPPVFNEYNCEDLSRTVTYLQRIAANLRRQRFEGGALQIDQPKVCFKLDYESGDPVDYFVYEHTEAHQLIEEFMLLANITVAERIKSDFPEIAFLRCHEPPIQRLMNKVKQILESCGVHIDISSAGAVQKSLTKYGGTDNLALNRMAVINYLFVKPMARARYFCLDSETDQESYQHYALNVPLYTHFTSPIRRYADIMVHRLLAASLGYAKKPNWEVDYVTAIAANCNKQKYNAKRAGEASTTLYLARYVELNQPFVKEGVIVDVKSRYFDVILVETGTVIRIHTRNFNEQVRWKVEGTGNMVRMKIDFPSTKKGSFTTCLFQIFSVVQIKLSRKEKTNKFEAQLLGPESE